jgi:hypothetical protein
MKKTGQLVGFLSLGIISQYAMAQNSGAQISPDFSTEALKNGAEVPGFFSSPPGVDLLKNAIINPDGSKTIKAGQQTPEGNELNRKYCESFGAKDVTNESDMTIGSGTLFAGVCVGAIGKHPPAKVQAVPGIGTGRIFLPMPDEDLEAQSTENFSAR